MKVDKVRLFFTLIRDDSPFFAGSHLLFKENGELSFEAPLRDVFIPQGLGPVIISLYLFIDNELMDIATATTWDRKELVLSHLSYLPLRIVRDNKDLIERALRET